MIFDKSGNIVNLVIIFIDDPKAGIMTGISYIDDIPRQAEIDNAVINYYCYRLMIRDEDKIEEVRNKYYSGDLNATVVIIESDDVLPFYEPPTDLFNDLISKDELSKMTSDALIEYKNILAEQSASYHPNHQFINLNKDAVDKEIKNRMNDR